MYKYIQAWAFVLRLNVRYWHFVFLDAAQIPGNSTDSELLFVVKSGIPDNPLRLRGEFGSFTRTCRVFRFSGIQT
jgi:hypothetical protein